MSIVSSLESHLNNLTDQITYLQNLSFDTTALEYAKKLMSSAIDDIKSSVSYKIAERNVYGTELSDEDIISLKELVEEQGFDVVATLVEDDLELLSKIFVSQ